VTESGQVRHGSAVDVDELRDVPVVLAAAIDAMPAPAAFRGWQAEPKYDGYLH